MVLAIGLAPSLVRELYFSTGVVVPARGLALATCGTTYLSMTEAECSLCERAPAGACALGGL